MVSPGLVEEAYTRAWSLRTRGDVGVAARAAPSLLEPVQPLLDNFSLSTPSWCLYVCMLYFVWICNLLLSLFKERHWGSTHAICSRPSWRSVARALR
jgi:hypothetical protein